MSAHESLLRWLWTNRIPLSFTKRASLKRLLKRILTAPAAISTSWRVERMRLKGARITNPVWIEKNVVFEGPMSNLIIESGAFIGTETYINTHGGIKLGGNSVINRGCTLLSASHDTEDSAWPTIRKSIIVGSDAWIATRAMILPGVTVGSGSVLAAGSVVAKDVPANRIAIGNPAKLLENKYRAAELKYSAIALTATFNAWTK